MHQENDYHCSLYMDDLQVSYAHTDIRETRVRLQKVLDNLSNWVTHNGFQFSPSKTKVMVFQVGDK